MTAVRFGLKAFFLTAILIGWIVCFAFLIRNDMGFQSILTIPTFAGLYYLISKRIDEQ